MSFYVVHDDGRMLVASDRPLLKAREARGVADVGALLANLHAMEADTRQRCEAAEETAQREGFAAGFEDGRRAFANGIAELATQADAHRREEESKIAMLALAALRRMIADIGDEAMMIGIARQAVAAVAPGGDTIVQVAPELAEPIAAALAEDGGYVAVRADETLAIHECRIAAADGRIIADLGVQIAAIEERWNVPHVD